MRDLDSRFLVHAVGHMAQLHGVAFRAFRHNVFCRVAAVIEHRIVDALHPAAEARLDPRLLALGARHGGADVRVVQVRARVRVVAIRRADLGVQEQMPPGQGVHDDIHKSG